MKENTTNLSVKCNLWFFSWRSSFTVNIPEPNRYIWKEDDYQNCNYLPLQQTKPLSTEFQNTISILPQSLTQTWLLVNNTPLQELFLLPHNLPMKHSTEEDSPAFPEEAVRKHARGAWISILPNSLSTTGWNGPLIQVVWWEGWHLYFLMYFFLLTLNKITKGSGHFWEERKNILLQKFFMPLSLPCHLTEENNCG